MRELDNTDKRRNGRIEEDRVIVENYFGRVKTLWGMAERTYRLRDDMYHSYMKLCFAFTNFHISIMPLREDDGDVERSYYRRILYHHKKVAQKRKERQEKTRRRKKARRSMTQAATDTNTSMSDLDSSDLEDLCESEDDEDDDE